MTKSRTYTFLARASLLSYILFGTAAAQGLVLCVEADGAINIEAALNGSCSSRPASTRGRSALPISLGDANAGESHCGSCLDFSLPQIGLGGKLFLIDTEAKTPRASSSAVFPVPASQARPSAGLALPARRTPPPAGSLVALRTVIFLI